MAGAGFVAYILFEQWKQSEASKEVYATGESDGFLGGFIKASNTIVSDITSSVYGEELPMQFSIQLLDYLKLWESTKRNSKGEHIVYDDEAGNPTIGYGHKIVSGDGFNGDSVISEIDAVGLLLNDIEKKAQKYVKKYVNVELTQNQFDALVSFTFNAGQDAMRRLASSVNSGNADVIPRVKTWNKVRKNGVLVPSNGLINRRNGDARIWEKAVYSR